MANQIIFFEEILQEIDRHVITVEGLLGLSEAQINAKTTAHDWSIGRQIEHLRLSTESNIDAINRLTEALPGITNNSEVSLSFAGRKIASVGGAYGNPNVPVPAYFMPRDQLYSKASIEHYFEIAKKYNASAKTVMTKKLDGIRVASPAMKLIKFTIPDLFAIFTSHGLRHLNQIELIRRDPSFPSN